jgi:GT2 family glycosyltransferase
VSETVTIIIPHYRAEVLYECLVSLYAHSDHPIQVLVIDDGGNAPSLQRAQAEFPQIEVLRNERNLGFTGSCNRGLEAAQTRYAVLLNDDTRVEPGWLAPLVAAAESDPAIAGCQPKLLSATEPEFFDYGGAAGGYIDALGYSFCRGRLFDTCERDEGQYDAEVPLFWACGSALFLRVEAAREVGFLDLDYFMHFEEIDLCWRLQLAGYRIRAVPQSVIYHHSGFSLPPASYRKTYLNHRNNLVMLCKNQTLGRLLWLLPLRLGLELLASLIYLLKGQWSSIPAPITTLLWCLTHPLNIYRRRRQSQAMRRVPMAREGVYAGSVLYQHFARGVKRASALMPEGRAS